ncbi:hypothetical protein S7711_10294 [Stachybotrys chartarum IBT 7711]|uniref:Uncharacterized protein n=1 Tax=Stachybotrys chartarum (strain CBS 109288 / IBT 7711) TaxID=1280523 RepID=A0A084B6Q2_STACB|nr:hypothetical protein S7711_10294 [Stachybotrys chartarum IBT 7711]
MLPSYLIGV